MIIMKRLNQLFTCYYVLRLTLVWGTIIAYPPGKIQWILTALHWWKYIIPPTTRIVLPGKLYLEINIPIQQPPIDNCSLLITSCFSFLWHRIKGYLGQANHLIYPPIGIFDSKPITKRVWNRSSFHKTHNTLKLTIEIGAKEHTDIDT